MNARAVAAYHILFPRLKRDDVSRILLRRGDTVIGAVDGSCDAQDIVEECQRRQAYGRIGMVPVHRDGTSRVSDLSYLSVPEPSEESLPAPEFVALPGPVQETRRQNALLAERDRALAERQEQEARGNLMLSLVEHQREMASSSHATLIEQHRMQIEQLQRAHEREIGDMRLTVERLEAQIDGLRETYDAREDKLRSRFEAQIEQEREEARRQRTRELESLRQEKDDELAHLRARIARLSEEGDAVLRQERRLKETAESDLERLQAERRRQQQAHYEEVEAAKLEIAELRAQLRAKGSEVSDDIRDLTQAVKAMEAAQTPETRALVQKTVERRLLPDEPEPSPLDRALTRFGPLVEHMVANAMTAPPTPTPSPREGRRRPARVAGASGAPEASGAQPEKL